jgi:hypothetical protein
MAYLTGGYRLNDTHDDPGWTARELVGVLRLMPIQVTRTTTPEDRTDAELVVTELQMRVVDDESQASMSVIFSDDQIVHIKIDDNNFGVTPIEMSRILYELGDYINAQLFVRKSPLRVVAAEYWWVEQATLPVRHRSRQIISTSVWERLLSDPSFQTQSSISRVMPPSPSGS